jgi:RimJ/RimL family protein N-acetyltransferase
MQAVRETADEALLPTLLLKPRQLVAGEDLQVLLEWWYSSWKCFRYPRTSWASEWEEGRSQLFYWILDKRLGKGVYFYPVVKIANDKRRMINQLNEYYPTGVASNSRLTT